MFETVSKGFRLARERLTGQGDLTEEVIDAALKDVRMSLLEADVEFRVVKQFLADVKQKALGEKVQLTAKSHDRKLRVRTEDHFVRICHDELVALMGPGDSAIETAKKGVTGIMMVGLQGSGKTTTTAKLARKLQKQTSKVMLVAADVYRPAAIHQLQVLGRQLDIPVFSREGGNPVDICIDATEEAARGGYDFVIYDTAGRLTVDEPLMEELQRIHARVHPANVFLVIDAMIGQDAVTTAKAFDQRIDVTGVILTKLDGDARGGAALSIRAVTGKPIKFLGLGETLDKLEDFRPDGLASRILGMGDLVGLMQDFQEIVDEDQAAKDAEKMLGGGFTMDDFLSQIRTIQQMGSMRDIMDKMPLASMFGGQIPQEALDQATDERELVKVEAMIQSMTRKERCDPELFLGDGDVDQTPAHARLSRRKAKPERVKDPSKFTELGPEAFVASRVQRVAKGSGHADEDVRGLVSRFLAMRSVFKMMGNLLGGGRGMFGNLPGIKQVRQLSALRKLSNNPEAMQSLFGGSGMGLGGMPGAMPSGAPLGALSGFSPRPHRPKETAAKRKAEKHARKKNRKK